MNGASTERSRGRAGLAAVVALLAGAPLVACDALELRLGPGGSREVEERTSEPAPTPPVEALGVDAAGLIEPVDPPAPAGNLRADLAAFVDVDRCVAERSKLDPLVGDALSAIGYDTFLRDACRLLEAAKEQRPETCARIDASALRGRCLRSVAVLAQKPDACPLEHDAYPARGRSPTCTALAARDPRLCAGEPRAEGRARCEALATRSDEPCQRISGADRASCSRELARWRELLTPPLDGLAKLPAARATLRVKGAGTTPNHDREVDLSADYARGAVVVTLDRRARVELGSVAESEGARIAPAPTKRARAGVAIALEPVALGGKEPEPVLAKLELELPGEATLVYPGAKCECEVTTARIDRARGGEVRVAVRGTLSLGTRAYEIALDVTTFVRDVVVAKPGSLPPLHPALGPSAKAPIRPR